MYLWGVVVSVLTAQQGVEQNQGLIKIPYENCLPPLTRGAVCRLPLHAAASCQLLMCLRLLLLWNLGCCHPRGMHMQDLTAFAGWGGSFVWD